MFLLKKKVELRSLSFRSVLETPSYRELTHLVSYDENITKKYMDDYEKGYLKCDWIEPEINILRNYRKRKRFVFQISSLIKLEELVLLARKMTRSRLVILQTLLKYLVLQVHLQNVGERVHHVNEHLCISSDSLEVPEFPSQERRDERNQKGKKAKVSLLSPTTSPNIIPGN